jgi:hypothetical protein
MNTITNPSPDVPLPPGAENGDNWERGDDGPERVIMGPSRGITDAGNARIWTSAIQLANGRIAVEEASEPPLVHLEGDFDLNSDQARELAAVLLEAAAELDSWVGR